MFLASELLQREESTTRLSEEHPWVVAFVFGLLHGFGFAGALEEISLPRGDIPVALLSFNLGVEAGQLFFVAVVLLLCSITPGIRSTTAGRYGPANVAAAYAVGGISAYWLIDRLAKFAEVV